MNFIFFLFFYVLFTYYMKEASWWLACKVKQVGKANSLWIENIIYTTNVYKLLWHLSFLRCKPKFKSTKRFCTTLFWINSYVFQFWYFPVVKIIIITLHERTWKHKLDKVCVCRTNLTSSSFKVFKTSKRSYKLTKDKYKTKLNFKILI